MAGSALVTTRLSSTTMKSATETIAKVHPVLVRDFIGTSPSLAVSVCLLTLLAKKKGSGLVGRDQALGPLGVDREQVRRRGDGEQHAGGEEGAHFLPLRP